MKVFKTLGVPVFAGLIMAASVLVPGASFAKDQLEGFEIGLSTGYRVDDFDWNIAGNIYGTNPNVLSELIWEDLEIYQFGIDSDLRIANPSVPFYGLFTGGADYGTIYSGSNRDSDYLGDNRTLEFRRSVNDAGDGEVWDLSVGAGPELPLFGNKLGLALLLGYSYHEQNLSLSDGFQVIPPQGAFVGLDSSYDAVWKGGWLGANLRFMPNGSFCLSGRFEYHQADYEAEANWNLRDELQHPVSFRHDASDGEGLVARLGAELALNEEFWLTMGASYQKWEADDGTDTVYLADGFILKTRLNEVNWESAGVTVGLKMVY